LQENAELNEETEGKIVELKSLVNGFHKKGRSIQIVIVEDDDLHADLIKQSLEKIHLINIMMFYNGESFLQYMVEKRVPDQEYVVFLDYHLPGLSGKEVLSKLKSNPELGKIPVIVVTGFDIPEVVSDFYKLGASFVIGKPYNKGEFFEVIYEVGKLLPRFKIPTV
jgi:response regulator RpfG family c-di-GMP phosphodiesterase